MKLISDAMEGNTIVLINLIRKLLIFFVFWF